LFIFTSTKVFIIFFIYGLSHDFTSGIGVFTLNRFLVINFENRQLISGLAILILFFEKKLRKRDLKKTQIEKNIEIVLFLISFIYILSIKKYNFLG